MTTNVDINISVRTPTIPVSEVYGPVVQGEGAVIGTPTVFVRLGGCDYHCSWCDSLYAVEVQYKDTWEALTPVQILDRVQELAGPGCLITLSGGNPALHRLTSLIEGGHDLGYAFAIETQGTRCPSWASLLNHITLSPKPPSSGMKTNLNMLSRWLAVATDNQIERCMKVVVFDEDDYQYACGMRELAKLWNCPMFMQAGTSNPYGQTDTFDGRSVFREAILQRTDWLSQKVLADKMWEVRVLPQMHALIYGAKRGV